MHSLQRITTEYIDSEDRIRISGQLAGAGTAVLWLTRRLLDRVVPHLTGWLEQGADTPIGLLDRDALHSFAQQSAQAQLDAEPAAPVRVTSTDAGSIGYLVQSVDITRGDSGVQLTFKGSGEPVALVLAAQPLRQWLGILFAQYQRGEWPVQMWPGWMAPEVGQRTGVAVH